MWGPVALYSMRMAVAALFYLSLQERSDVGGTRPGRPKGGLDEGGGWDRTGSWSTSGRVGLRVGGLR